MIGKKLKGEIYNWLLDLDISQFTIKQKLEDPSNYSIVVETKENDSRIEIEYYGIGHWLLWSDLTIIVFSKGKSFSFHTGINKKLYNKLKPIIIKKHNFDIERFRREDSDYIIFTNFVNDYEK